MKQRNALHLACLMGLFTMAAQAQAKTDVVLWYAGGAKPQQMMQTLIDEFNKSQNNYEVKASLQASYTETFQKLQAAMASKTAPSAVLLTGEQATGMASRQLLRDLRPYMDANFNFADFVPTFRAAVTAADQSVYGLPAYGTTQVFYYNKKVLADHGFTEQDLATWQGVAKVAAKVTDAYVAQRHDGERFLDTYRRLGAKPFKEAVYG